jgi:hypothetical protein
MLVRGLKTGDTAAAILLGVSFAFYLFFSFSASILGVLMALTTAIGWWLGVFPTRNVIRAGAISVAFVFGSIALLYLTTRFNLIACFIGAVRGHQAQQGNEGFDDVRRWLLRSTGNILAYVFSIVPLSILAVSAVRRAKLPAASTQADAYRIARSLFAAAVATVLIAGFSGLFYVETERIWIFLTPVFALAAGYELSRRATPEGQRIIHVVLLMVLIISCTQEF